MQPGGLTVAPYQLVRVMRALSMTRPRLLLADRESLGSHDALRRLLTGGEGQFFYRKIVRDQIAAYVAAFANADGGTLVLGVEDDGTVTGCGRAAWGSRAAADGAGLSQIVSGVDLTV